MRITSLPLLVLLFTIAMLAAGCGSDGGSDARDTTTDTAGAGADGGGGSGVTADETFSIQVSDGKVIGGPQAMKVRVGDTVRIEMLADAPDEAHLHGIGAEAKVDPAGVIEFTAEEAGSYELELHDSGLVLGSLQVT